MSTHRFFRLIVIVAILLAAVPLSASAAAHNATGSGQLIVKRAANFGLNLTLTLWIDGRPADRLQLGRAFSATLPAGPHEVRAVVTERRLDSSPTVRRVVIHPGATTQLTAGFHGQDLVLR
jgi:hypothetical protein